MLLHEIAPRLAFARDVERFNYWCAGDDVGRHDGDRWAETVGTPTQETGRCGLCGGATRIIRFAQRIIGGCNDGHVSTLTEEKCPSCRWGHLAVR